MTPEFVAAAVASAISLALEIVPGLRQVWEKVATQWKPLIVFVLCFAIPYGLSYLACAGVYLGGGAVCPADAQSHADLIMLGILAFVSSQATFAAIGQSLSERLD